MYFGNLGVYVPRREPFGNHPTLVNNLFSYWRMEETSTGVGSVRVDAHQGRDLTVTDAACAVVTGKNGSAYRAVGGSYLRRVTPLYTAANNLTVSAWISSTGFAGGPVVAGTSSPTGWDILGSPANTLSARLVYGGGAGFVAANSTNYTQNGTFHHVLVMYNGTARTASISINGEALVTSSAAPSALVEGTSFYAAYDTTGDLFTVDELGIWGRLLTLDERSALYSGGVGLFY